LAPLFFSFLQTKSGAKPPHSKRFAISVKVWLFQESREAKVEGVITRTQVFSVGEDDSDP
jgi:hypothetical protein